MKNIITKKNVEFPFGIPAKVLIFFAVAVATAVV